MTDTDTGGSLQGRRILVVEDEYILAEDLCGGLEEAGAEVIGPVATVAAALARVAAEDRIDGAVLDVNLHGVKVFPVADALRQRGTPFVFATGYVTGDLPAAYAGVRCCEKPYDARLCAALLFGAVDARG